MSHVTDALAMKSKGNDEKYFLLPTKQIVNDDSASGKSMSAGSTSEFGHESFTKIIEVFGNVKIKSRRDEKRRGKEKMKLDFIFALKFRGIT